MQALTGRSATNGCREYIYRRRILGALGPARMDSGCRIQRGTKGIAAHACAGQTRRCISALLDVKRLILAGCFKIKTSTPVQSSCQSDSLCLPPPSLPLAPALRFPFSPEMALTGGQVEVMCVSAWWDNDTSAAKVLGRLGGQRRGGLTPTEAGAEMFVVTKGALDKHLGQMILCLAQQCAVRGQTSPLGGLRGSQEVSNVSR